MVAVVVVVAATGAAGSASADPGGDERVVVTGPGAAAAVRASGGRVIAMLPLVDGVAAALPAGTRLGPQWTVAPARELHVASTPSAPSGGTPVRATLGLPPDGTEGAGTTV